MIVVADSGPLHYLILLDATSLLHRFYGEVLLPDAVAAELRAARLPQQVQDWMASPPSLAPVHRGDDRRDRVGHRPAFPERLAALL